MDIFEFVLLELHIYKNMAAQMKSNQALWLKLNQSKYYLAMDKTCN